MPRLRRVGRRRCVRQRLRANDLACAFCAKTFKNAGGRIEHENWCKEGPRVVHGDEQPADDDDGDVDDTLLCNVCELEISNKGARATHQKACEAKKAAAEARGETFVSSVAARLERVRRLAYSFAYKQRALIAVQARVARDQRDVATAKKERRARQKVAEEFRVLFASF